MEEQDEEDIDQELAREQDDGLDRLGDDQRR